ncbi:hypothetical protein [Nocardioides sp.]|uniref:hypothetical protein n=1 Tax=Nocardioides sp. TaxID=35761 RepID=UPI0035B40FA9
MTDLQRIFVVTAPAGAAEVAALRARLGRDLTVVTAPTAEAREVVEGLVGGSQHEPVPDVLLAPVRFPDVDRGHRLDDLVRRHAVADRWRDVVVVADPATVTLLLRVLAPDQLPAAGPVTEVGLPRGSRPVPLARALVGGVLLALASGLLASVVQVWVLPLLAVVAGLALLVAPGRRHLGETLLIAVAVAVLVGVLAIAGSSRFPGAW